MPTIVNGVTYNLTVGGVACAEIFAGTGVESFDFTPSSQSYSATRIYLCQWANRGSLINGLRLTAHPLYSYLNATGFSVAPHGKPSGTSTFDEAIITVTYKNLPYSTADFKEIQVETSAENVSFQGEGTEFETGATPADTKVDFDPNVFVATTTYNVTIHNATSINEAAWAAKVNCVNSSAFNVGGTGYRSWDEGHLLYVGYAIAEKIASDGKHFEVTHKFVGCDTHSHQEEWNPKIGDWDAITLKQTGGKKYDETSFAGLV